MRLSFGKWITGSAICAFASIGLIAGANAQAFNQTGEQALSNQISTLRNMVISVVADLRETLNSYERCARKEMLYAPDTNGADNDGCVGVGKISCGYTGTIGVTSTEHTTNKLSITCSGGYVTSVEGSTAAYDPCWFNHDDAGPCGYGKK